MVLLEGCAITEADFSIKFPKWHKGQVFERKSETNSLGLLSRYYSLNDSPFPLSLFLFFLFFSFEAICFTLIISFFLSLLPLYCF